MSTGTAKPRSAGPQQLQPSLPGRPRSSQHQLEGLGAQHLGGGLGVVHQSTAKPSRLQSRADRLPDHGIVLYQQQSHDVRSYDQSRLRSRKELD